MPYVRAKGWMKSKILLLCALAIVYGLQSLLMEQPLLGAYTEQALILLGAAIGVLRTRTSTPLSSHPTQDQSKPVVTETQT